jgi:hypothetical protein
MYMSVRAIGSVCMQVTDRTEDLRSRRRESENSVVLLTMFRAEYRTWQGVTRSPHSLLGVVQLAHASAAHVHERESQ